MDTGTEKKWRLVYYVGQIGSTTFLFAVSADDAKAKVLAKQPDAIFTLVTEDKRDPDA